MRKIREMLPVSSRCKPQKELDFSVGGGLHAVADAMRQSLDHERVEKRVDKLEQKVEEISKTTEQILAILQKRDQVPQ